MWFSDCDSKNVHYNTEMSLAMLLKEKIFTNTHDTTYAYRL